MFTISGRTYEYRNQLKAVGCRWNAAQKVWETSNPAAARQAEAWPGVKVYGDATTMKPVEDLRIEYPSAGATYCDYEYGVYKYDRYPKSSVLGGQVRRQFLGSYLTEELAKAAHPNALPAACGYREPYLNHLSDEEGSW